MRNKIVHIFLLCSVFGFSQNITFSDSDLLTYLTTKLCVDTDEDGVFDSTADFNNDNQIQLSEAKQVTHFAFNSLAHNIQSLDGFENFSNLIYLGVTTIDVNQLDFSVFQSLQTLKLSSSIDNFTFNNPALTHFELQNVGFNNPLFDLTNLPNLEYIRIQSYHLTDNLIFGTHNNLEELRILAGTYSSLNLSGMPALKYLTIDEFIGTDIDISNNTLLEEFIFSYTDDLNSVLGSNASTYLEKIDFIQDEYYDIPSNLDLTFNNQALTNIKIRGVNSFSLSNNNVAIGDLELLYVNESLNIHNSNFAYIDSYLDSSLRVSNINSNNIYLTNIEGLRFLTLQNLSSNSPMDLSTVKSERISLSSCSITELNLKNGDVLQQFNSSSDTNIQFICTDSNELGVVENGYQNNNSSVVIHPYCTFVLGGDYYEITGDILLDVGTGCLPYATTSSIFDMQFTVTDNISSDTFYVNNLNEYYHTLPEGDHILSSQLVESDYWTINPSSINLSFPSGISPFVQDFCIIPNGIYNDIEVTVIPLEAARPGFETDYRIIYKNKGSTTLSGNIDFTFDDDFMDLLSSSPIANSQSTGNLVWNYANLQPFETRTIDFTMILNAPTDSDFPLNSDDFLYYSVSVNPVASDETPDDNTFSLNQEVVNSYDPNDKTCLEGETVALEKVGKYVHYLVRFENTGSANAINVVVKDIINTTKYDLSSLTPLNASHDFYTRIRNGNEVEFIFENIQLPFDDANNDGYILFKIKTLSTLNIGDSFSNEANIFFDYNVPIITNNATTTVQENLSIEDFNISNAKVYPNPTANYFKIENLSNSNIKSIVLYNISGKKLKVFSISENYEINDLSSGIYFINIITEQSEIKRKLIKL